jgi:excisionase family DNA binding protein
MTKVSIREASELLGVHQSTLRRWEEEGRLVTERTPGGHRRYDPEQLIKTAARKSGDKRQTIAYGRVSSRDQRIDLRSQVLLLETYCAANGWSFEVIEDLGSGINYNKKGLRELIQRICRGQVERLVLTHKDRLLRFGSELVFALCEEFEVEIVIINQSDREMSFEEELAQDVLEIITVFSARLYGSRSHKNKKLVEQLRSAAEEL